MELLLEICTRCIPYMEHFSQTVEYIASSMSGAITIGSLKEYTLAVKETQPFIERESGGLYQRFLHFFYH